MSADSTQPALGVIPGVTGIHRQTQPTAETRPDTPRTSRSATRAVLAAAPQITSSAPSRINDPAHFN